MGSGSQPDRPGQGPGWLATLSALPHAQPGASRSAAMLPFGIVGVVCVVAGGLVAAATAPAPTEHGGWAAAYLVLVA